MKTFRSTLFPLAFVAATLVAGCGSTGMGDVLGGGRTTDQNGSYDRLGADVRGTVQRVSTRDRYIVVDEESSRSNLRNGSQETFVYYDDRTKVDYQGKTFRPEDLEVGDRVAAETTRSGDRLLAENIQVLYDVTGGGSDTYRNDDRSDTYRNDTLGSDLRGTVSYVDTRNRTVEVVPSSNDPNYSRSDRVLVHYDSGTVVEFGGRQYQPENLERGDAVEVQIRDSGGQLLAQRIVVTAEGQSVGR